MKLIRFVSENRWPLYLSGLLGMAIAAYAVLIFVATRPGAPRPIPRYYEASQQWDVDEAAEEASRQLGWSVTLRDPEGRAARGGHAPPRRRAGGRPRGEGRRRAHGPALRGEALGPAPEPVGAARGAAPPGRQLPRPRGRRPAGSLGASASTRSRTPCASFTPPASNVAPDPAARERPGEPAGRGREAPRRDRLRALRAPGARLPPARGGPAVLLRRLRAGVRPHPGVGVRRVLPLRRPARRPARAGARQRPGLRGAGRPAARRGVLRSPGAGALPDPPLPRGRALRRLRLARREAPRGGSGGRLRAPQPRQRGGGGRLGPGTGRALADRPGTRPPGLHAARAPGRRACRRPGDRRTGPRW